MISSCSFVSLASIDPATAQPLWFSSCLTDRTQCVPADGFTSASLPVTKGVPQVSVLGPLLFVLYISGIDQNITTADFHFYADDTVMYCSC